VKPTGREVQLRPRADLAERQDRIAGGRSRHAVVALAHSWATSSATAASPVSAHMAQPTSTTARSPLEADKLSQGGSREGPRTSGLGNAASKARPSCHNEALERQAAKNADRSKFVPAGQYMGEDGIYRPVVMDQSTGRLVDLGHRQGRSRAGAKVQGAKGDTGFTDEEAKNQSLAVSLCRATSPTCRASARPRA
jgi:hypothetical protein